MTLELAGNFLTALLIGALVGLEREKKKSLDPSPSLGGIRTHMLIALVGAASAWLSQQTSMHWAFTGALVIVGAAVVASYVRQQGDSAAGLTSEIAALAVFLLGAMAVTGYVAPAVALAVVTSALLAFKQPLHSIVRRIGVPDIYAGIKLLIASFIVLPLLPDETIDPWQAINPYKLWLLVIMISGLSLVGYVAMRWLGSARGTAVTGIAGGLVSSTAATLSFARAARGDSGAADLQALAAGILLAWLVMVARIAFVLAVLNLGLLLAASVPLAAMGAVTAGFAALRYRAGMHAGSSEATSGAIKNPFSLASAIRFGLLFAAVLLFFKLVQQYFPGVGMIPVAMLAGSVDVDAISLTIAEQTRSNEQFGQAAAAIAAAALANTAVKFAFVASLGGAGLRRLIWLPSACILVAGTAGAVWAYRGALG